MLRLKPSEFDSASAERFLTEAAFYVEVERKYFTEMGRYLKEDLGVRAPVWAPATTTTGAAAIPC